MVIWHILSCKAPDEASPLSRQGKQATAATGRSYGHSSQQSDPGNVNTVHRTFHPRWLTVLPLLMAGVTASAQAQEPLGTASLHYHDGGGEQSYSCAWSGSRCGLRHVCRKLGWMTTA